MLHGEAFDMRLLWGAGIAGANNSASKSGTATGILSFKYSLNTTSATPIVFSSSQDIAMADAVDIAGSAGASISSSVAKEGFTAIVSSSQYISIGLPSLTSISPALALTVTPYVEQDGTPGPSGGDLMGDPYVINFVPWSGLGSSVTLGALIESNVGVTASVVVKAGNVRWAQLNGQFGVAFTSTNDVTTVTSGTISATPVSNATPGDTSRTGAEMVTANYSFSAVVLTAALSASPQASISAKLFYFASAPAFNANQATDARALGVSTLGVTAKTIQGLSLSPVVGVNMDGSGNVRYNSAFTLNAFPRNASVTTSVAVASDFSVDDVQTGITFDADSGVVLNGVSYTSASAFASATFSLPAGQKTVAVETFGQEVGGTETITFKLSAQNLSSVLTITLVSAVQTVIYVPAAVAGLAGVAKTFAVTAEDQFGVKSPRSDQRIAASVVLGGSTSATVSAPVVNGAASVTVMPTPATRTGSAKVTFTLQTFDQATQAWKSGGTSDTADWNIYSYVAGSDSITSRTVSISSSISYGVALSWSPTAVAVVVANSFSDVVASAPGLMIQNVDSLTATASDVLTIAANGKTANFKFTSRLAGTYTVTFTNGTATTTSTVVVGAAAHDSGATLTFDKASIAAGTTTTVTGTLKDVNGNPVATGGTASVAVAWAGKGLPFGNTTTMQTNAAGELTFYVLVLSGEMGDAAIAATYKPAGLAVSTKNVSVVHAVAVGKAAASAAADQKITIGTYKGYVAVFTKGYAGQKLSVQVASKWHVRNPIVDLKAGYSLLTINTGAGYVANVIVYIDGVEVERMTITTK